MKFRMVHNNFNVLDLEKSLAFYGEALDMREVRRIEKPDFTIVYLEKVPLLRRRKSSSSAVYKS